MEFSRRNFSTQTVICNFNAQKYVSRNICRCTYIRPLYQMSHLRLRIHVSYYKHIEKLSTDFTLCYNCIQSSRKNFWSYFPSHFYRTEHSLNFLLSAFLLQFPWLRRRKLAGQLVVLLTSYSCVKLSYRTFDDTQLITLHRNTDYKFPRCNILQSCDGKTWQVYQTLSGTEEKKLEDRKYEKEIKKEKEFRGRGWEDEERH